MSHIYVLPKTNKQDVPLRFIMSIVNSTYQNVARWLADKLKLVRQRLVAYKPKNPIEFGDSMDYINMISIDVTLLLTKIPLLESIDIIC